MTTIQERLQNLFGATVYSLALFALFSSLTTLAVADEAVRATVEPATAETVPAPAADDFGLAQVDAALRAETQADLAARLKADMAHNRIRNERIAKTWSGRAQDGRLN